MHVKRLKRLGINHPRKIKLVGTIKKTEATNDKKPKSNTMLNFYIKLNDSR